MSAGEESLNPVWKQSLPDMKREDSASLFAKLSPQYSKALSHSAKAEQRTLQSH